MNRASLRTMVLSSVGTIVLFALLFFLVDITRVIESIRTAESGLVVVVFLLALCWLMCWSLMLKTVLASLDIEISAVTAFFIYSGAVFANNVTPFGQAGGEPVAALFISKVSGARYEKSLVGIASVDVLNVVPSISMVFVGVGYYATTATVGDRLVAALGSAVVLITVVVIAITFVWRNHATIIDRFPAIIAPKIGRIGGRYINTAYLEERLQNRLGHFFENVEYVATDRWRITSAIGLSLCGWLLQSVALLVAFAALGYAIPLGVALFVVPLAYVAGVAPLPGGLGGIEASFVTLLVPTTGLPAAVVTAGVLIFRGAIYWMPVVIGGLSFTALGSREISL